MQDEIVGLLKARRGHFLLDAPPASSRSPTELGRRLAAHGIEAVCGPLTGGAFLAQSVAAQLDVEVSSTERPAAGYRIPDALRATMEQLRECGARTVAVGPRAARHPPEHAVGALRMPDVRGRRAA